MEEGITAKPSDEVAESSIKKRKRMDELIALGVAFDVVVKPIPTSSTQTLQGGSDPQTQSFHPSEAKQELVSVGERLPPLEKTKELLAECAQKRDAEGAVKVLETRKGHEQIALLAFLSDKLNQNDLLTAMAKLSKNPLLAKLCDPVYRDTLGSTTLTVQNRALERDTSLRLSAHLGEALDRHEEENRNVKGDFISKAGVVYDGCSPPESKTVGKPGAQKNVLDDMLNEDIDSSYFKSLKYHIGTVGQKHLAKKDDCDKTGLKPPHFTVIDLTGRNITKEQLAKLVRMANLARNTLVEDAICQKFPKEYEAAIQAKLDELGKERANQMMAEAEKRIGSRATFKKSKEDLPNRVLEEVTKDARDAFFKSKLKELGVEWVQSVLMECTGVMFLLDGKVAQFGPMDLVELSEEWLR